VIIIPRDIEVTLKSRGKKKRTVSKEDFKDIFQFLSEKELADMIFFLDKKYLDIGRIILFEKLYKILYKEYGNKVSKKELESLMKKLEKRGTIEILKFKNNKLIYFQPGPLSKQIKKILEIAVLKPALTLDEISKTLKTDIEEAEEFMKEMTDLGISEQEFDGTGKISYIFPGLTVKE